MGYRSRFDNTTMPIKYYYTSIIFFF
ncbi:hypothetical protein, partial [Plasmodium yoelii yoelii]